MTRIVIRAPVIFMIGICNSQSHTFLYHIGPFMMNVRRRSRLLFATTPIKAAPTGVARQVLQVDIQMNQIKSELKNSISSHLYLFQSF